MIVTGPYRRPPTSRLVETLSSREIALLANVLRAVLLFLALPLTACSNQDAAVNLAGKWRCGPTTMLGPGLVVRVVEVTTNQLDGTFTSDTETTISANAKPPLTLLTRSTGTWQFRGDVWTTNVHEATFISASDPTLTHEVGQAALDEQTRKKSIFRSRLVSVDKGVYRFMPQDSMYPEAAVASVCSRI